MSKAWVRSSIGELPAKHEAFVERLGRVLIVTLHLLGGWHLAGNLVCPLVRHVTPERLDK
ncbi:hypothetical protein IE4872_PD01042 (plasmid) [Rhizobium gallicum]|uniref:Uncharacterized protein n=1 Tax=Rhizobium gallicum TaxID=56730 RepID=A0A1L5NUP0_9HYPH|nr:hypothetical protein IE4872_PD01042 [Rhizobium gallicum]